MIVEGLPLVEISAYHRHCPKHRIVIVGVQDEELERDSRDPYPHNLCKWVFGPKTENAWPRGDYYVGETYIEPSFQDYHGFYRGDTHGEYFAIDPDILMDAGL